jgi:predicted transcriptional regulator of viral defense system
MIYQEFRKAFFKVGCFSSRQVYAWRTQFDKNNLGRWVKKGWLVKLRNGYYSFPEYLNEPDFVHYIANRIYRPSYISLHSALAFYGIIPESIVQTTSVTTLKTALFENPFGTFSYKTIKPELFFGYETKTLRDDRTMLISKPEKALVDLLYLYPGYDSEEELEGLRLDEEIMHELIDEDLLQAYVARYRSNALKRRTALLIKTVLN